MNRLWVRLSLMISGVLFLVFFWQFLSIIMEDEGRAVARPDHVLEAPDGPPRDEIARRLINFAGLSLFVGLIGGAIIGRVVSRPIGDLVQAARTLKLNLSEVLERALEQEVREGQRRAWLAENEQAIADYNAQVEKRGVFSDDWRRF